MTESAFDGRVWNAAKTGNVDELETALATHGDLIDTPHPSTFSWTPMFVAARHGHVAVIETLVRLGSKAIDTPTIGKWSPLFVAAYHGHAAVIETLIRLGSSALDSPSSDGLTPLYAAAEKGHVNAIETLVRLGSQAVDTPTMHGWIPMHQAAFRGDVSVIEALVRAGSRAIDLPNKLGFPLHWAAANGHTAAVEALVRLGSQSINDLTPQGRTALGEAARFRHGPCVRVLMCLGASLNDSSFVMVSPLMVERMRAPISEDEVAEVRFRVYFSRSLAHRLLFAAPPDLCSPHPDHPPKSSSTLKCIVS